MTREGLTEKLLDIKRDKGWTWKYICEAIGGMSPILVTGKFLPFKYYGAKGNEMQLGFKEE